MPLVFKAIAVDVSRTLDLTDIDLLHEIGIGQAELRENAWWQSRWRGEEAITQAIGRAAHATGVQALIVASAQTLEHGKNLVVFPDHVKRPMELKVLRRPGR